MAIITISRGTKSGGLELARCLSGRLGYESISREVILEKTKDYSLMEEDFFMRVDESPTLWQKLTRQHRRNLVLLQCAFIDAVKGDNVVYHGYAGQLFLRGVKHVLKVRVEAPLEHRLAIVMRESGMNRNEAEDYIAKIDEERIRWVKGVYGEHWRDPSLYDMSFYTSTLRIDTICEIIGLAIDRGGFQTTPESSQKLADLSLECRVRAAFAADDHIWNLGVTVSASGGVITLSGTVDSEQSRDVIVKMASGIEGVKDCRVEIGM